MKKNISTKKSFEILLLVTFIASLFASCTPIQRNNLKETPPILTYLYPVVSTPTGVSIQPFNDVRFLGLAYFDKIENGAIIESLRYNTSTIFPEENRSEALEILEKGKNPGLGVRALHEQGITGKGVTVAIIDQYLFTDHPEYQRKIVKYNNLKPRESDIYGSMHGPGVTSLLVGENTGTAPGAMVYYAAIPGGDLDAQYFADALNWIVEENEKLPANNKIRVVSVSAAPSGEGSPFTKNNASWDAAYKKATNAGILVLDCTSQHAVAAPCYLDLDNPDNPDSCTPGWYEGYPVNLPDRLYIPTSHRSMAEAYSKGSSAYQYTGVGGLSWAIPYLAGVLAMGWQINPDLTGEQMLEIAFDTAYITDEGYQVINPPAFIEKVKNTVKQK